MVGNCGLVLLIGADAHLRAPMHAFLRSLSLLDACYSSTIAPRALADLWAPPGTVSFAGCAAQFFFLSLFGTAEAFLLAAMAYDRFVAICCPLLYPARVSRRLYARLVLGSFCCGALNATTQTTMTFTLSFCGPNGVHGFFCDMLPLLSLSCWDTSVNQLVLLGLCGSIIVGTFLAVSASYLCIISAILRIKAFATCASHLTGVCLFFGTVFFMYVQPSALSSLEQGKVVSVFYTIVIPMLNPLIYSLRNSDVRRALSRAKRSLSCGGGAVVS